MERKVLSGEHGRISHAASTQRVSSHRNERLLGVGCGKGRNDTLSVEGPLFVVPRSFLHEAFPTNTSLSWRAAMRPHDRLFHGRDSRKSISYLFTINCNCGNVFETARTSLMSLIGYARVSTAEGRQVLDRQLDRTERGWMRARVRGPRLRRPRPTARSWPPVWITCARAMSLSSST